ncbi:MULTISPECIES: hypothetical protein [Streptomyces]|uniref:Uncharacterized protein n=1 Tax=Streptomyces doudnae TaxID=3075536 RepID=A0ABD5EI96_9ACTN|nr:MULTISPECIES: hypothetical protein [unclassified Streptomyces]MDT0433132.1 hypothetical protein [Streptomyces sp. DSM 41981]MYQ66367.1 hypothetical protein [Streptomyces sp. SID4950]SCE18997.1 hypothetical protein GA0115242_125039 [Streptomyces sp. SolWspMP-5a-2]
MRFLLEVTLDDDASDADRAAGLGRILRYWGGNLHRYALRDGTGEAVYDSAYTEVGQWRVSAS